MDNVMLLSKFKSGLGDIINDFNDKIVDVEKKEEFLQVLSDLVNYSKSDALLLPFYDENLLSDVFKVVFPIFSSHMNKLKVAKYLIESSEGVDKEHFPQYNDAVKDLNDINNDLIKYYEDLVSNNSYASDKENYNVMISKYTSILDLIGEDSFTSLIDDIDLFHDSLYECNFSSEEINKILNIAIISNLNYLNDNGVLDVQEDVDNTLKEATRNLSELTQSSLQEALWDIKKIQLICFPILFMIN